MEFLEMEKKTKKIRNQVITIIVITFLIFIITMVLYLLGKVTQEVPGFGFVLFVFGSGAFALAGCLDVNEMYSQK